MKILNALIIAIHLLLFSSLIYSNDIKQNILADLKSLNIEVVNNYENSKDLTKSQSSLKQNEYSFLQLENQLINIKNYEKLIYLIYTILMITILSLIIL